MSYDHLDSPFAEETDSASLTLVSHKLCPYVQRAAIALTEKQVPFLRIDIDLAAKPAWFTQISPLGKVPVLRVFDLGMETAIFESAVILEYLEDTQPNPLHPADPLERARHRSWIEFASATLDAIARFYAADTPAEFEAAADRLRGQLEQIEQELCRDREDGPWFGGTAFGLVDAAFAPVFRYFETFEAIGCSDFFSDLPHTRAWRAALAERPSVRDAVSADYPQLLLAFLRARGSVISDLVPRAA